MKGILGFITVIASVVAAFFVANGGVSFVRDNYRKYITLKENKSNETE